jgi:hypothetical protein
MKSREAGKAKSRKNKKQRSREEEQKKSREAGKHRTRNPKEIQNLPRKKHKIKYIALPKTKKT